MRKFDRKMKSASLTTATLNALLVIVLLGAGIYSGPVQSAEPIQMGIMTGGLKGTYYQFGLNIQQLVNTDGIELRVDNSKGSVENIYSVYQKPKTQLGIVQSDVLAFVSQVQTNPLLKRIAKKTKMVFPLYNEEIHLVGKKEINGFDYLSDKKVAIGKEGSGTYLTAKLLFKVAGFEPAEMITIGTDDALQRIKDGSIDAMFYVAGYPVKLFNENVTPEDNLAVIPILNKSVLEFYPQAEIPAGTYAWQENAVTTAAVKAVLISYDFRRYHCDTVGRVAKNIYENFDWLKANGHPKWNSVDLNYPLKGWDQYDCVKKYLAGARRQPAKPASRTINPVLDAIKEMMPE